MSGPEDRFPMKSEGIISDGRGRWQKVCEDQVRAEVGKAFAEELRRAGPIERICLRWKMHREINRRLAELSSPYDLHGILGAGGVAPGNPHTSGQIVDDANQEEKRSDGH